MAATFLGAALRRPAAASISAGAHALSAWEGTTAVPSSSSRSWPKPIAWRQQRHSATVPAAVHKQIVPASLVVSNSSLETREQQAEEEAWLPLRYVKGPEPLQEPAEDLLKPSAAADASTDKALLPPSLGETPEGSQLEKALVKWLKGVRSPTLVGEAFRAVYQSELPKHRLKLLLSRLKELQLDDGEAVVLLHCLVKANWHDKGLLEHIAERIESRYFSMELGMPTTEQLSLFYHRGSFQSLIFELPFSHKVELMLVGCTERDTGRHRAEKPPKVLWQKTKKEWKTMDPAEMEAVERVQFKLGHLKVKRMQHVEAKVYKMSGKKLRSTLALQALQVVPFASTAELAEIAQVLAFPQVRLLAGNLQEDFREALARRVCNLERNDVEIHALAFASGLSSGTGPTVCAAWKRKLVPAILMLLRPGHQQQRVDLIAAAPPSLTEEEVDRQVCKAFDQQILFHRRLGGVRQVLGVPKSGEEMSVRAERASRLFIAVLTARQVEPDCELYDALARPIKVLARDWLEALELEQAPPLLLRLETLADLLSAVASCGIVDEEFPQCLADLFTGQFGEDIRTQSFTLSKYALTDVSAIAHGVSLHCANVEEVLELLWKVGQPKLATTRPAFVLMLLNAMARGGSEQLITSPEVYQAVDEFLVQKLDFDTAALGKIGL